MKAMILAAGYGKRLLPLTKEIPKPLLMVGKKTLIERNIEILLDNDFDNFVINVSYLSQMIKDHVSKTFPLVNIEYSEEAEPLGTGGGVLKAIDLLGREHFLLVNADLCHEINIKNLAQEVPSAHLVGVKNPDHNPDGDFSLDGNTVVIKKGPNDLTWSGISVINPVIFNSLNGRKGSFEIWDSVLKEQIKNKTVTGEFSQESWIDTGTIDRLELANNIVTDEN